MNANATNTSGGPPFVTGGPPFMVGASDLPLTVRLARFAVGLVLLAMFAGLFMSGFTPPGIAGEVVRHNRLHDIDASPLLYSEVEHMQQLEEGVRQMRERQRP